MASEQSGLRWDMLRARDHGKIVYRHLSGLLRVVRGRLMLKTVSVPALGRASITAKFICDTAGPDDPPPLQDAHLVHADETRLVLSGYECITDLDREVHYGQTWVLMPCEGERPEATRGPPFPS
jgi:hypothetical protein